SWFWLGRCGLLSVRKRRATNSELWSLVVRVSEVVLGSRLLVQDLVASE
ncbi:hypothetical protein LINPERHAP1_LOCUS27365, partial [Linum perenne]